LKDSSVNLLKELRYRVLNPTIWSQSHLAQQKTQLQDQKRREEPIETLATKDRIKPIAEVKRRLQPKQNRADEGNAPLVEMSIVDL